MSKKKFIIYGGCVTRDVFTNNYDKLGAFDLLKYFARYSLAKVVFDPVDNLPEFSLSSNFQKNMLKQEFNNELMDALVDFEYDYLIFDFLTIRLSIISYDKTFVTESLELKSSGVLDNNNFKRIKPTQKLFWYFWEKGLLAVIENMTKRGQLHKLYIQKLYWATIDSDGNLLPDQDNIRIQNLFLEKAYNIASCYLHEKQFIEYPRELFVSDKNHRWGVSPIHYINDFYEEAYRQFNRLDY